MLFVCIDPSTLLGPRASRVVDRETRRLNPAIVRGLIRCCCRIDSRAIQSQLRLVAEIGRAFLRLNILVA